MHTHFPFWIIQAGWGHGANGSGCHLNVLFNQLDTLIAPGVASARCPFVYWNIMMKWGTLFGELFYIDREVVSDDSVNIYVREVRIGNETLVTQVTVGVLAPNPFGTIVYVLTRDIRVRY